MDRTNGSIQRKNIGNKRLTLYKGQLTKETLTIPTVFKNGVALTPKHDSNEKKK